jgi:hypothetical protein
MRRVQTHILQKHPIDQHITQSCRKPPSEDFIVNNQSEWSCSPWTSEFGENLKYNTHVKSVLTNILDRATITSNNIQLIHRPIHANNLETTFKRLHCNALNTHSI